MDKKLTKSPPSLESASYTFSLADAPPPNPIAAWAWSVCWLDGVMPLVMISVPRLAINLFPGHDRIHVLINVLFPIAALFIRYNYGVYRFERRRYYFWQICLFAIALVLLVFFDSLLILLHTVALDSSPQEWLVICGLYLLYLAMMAIAFFPFRRKESEPNCELRARKH